MRRCACQVNMLMSNKGTVLRCDVNGKIVMKVFLSGMPDVKLGLNDKLEVRSSGACIDAGIDTASGHERVSVRHAEHDAGPRYKPGLRTQLHCVHERGHACVRDLQGCSSS